MPQTPKPFGSPSVTGHGAAAVAALFGAAPVSLLVGSEATEARLVELAPRAAILHLAAHGLADDESPLATRVALAAGGGADGLWTAREALELGLEAELVVLAACSSASGKLSGEGALGFGHALLGAGVRAVVASLWPVPDEIAAFELESFYRALLDGADRGSALRAARSRPARRSPRAASPRPAGAACRRIRASGPRSCCWGGRTLWVPSRRARLRPHRLRPPRPA